MKPLKKATQKNVLVNFFFFFYTHKQLDENAETIAETVEGAIKNEFFKDDTEHVRISLNYVKDLKIKPLHEGYYMTVTVMYTAVMYTGEEMEALTNAKSKSKTSRLSRIGKSWTRKLSSLPFARR